MGRRAGSDIDGRASLDVRLRYLHRRHARRLGDGWGIALCGIAGVVMLVIGVLGLIGVAH